MALFVSKECTFLLFYVILKKSLRFQKEKVLHLSQETEIGRSVFKALTSHRTAVEKLSNKLLFYLVLYSASIVNATLSNTDTQSQSSLTQPTSGAKEKKYAAISCLEAISFKCKQKL